MAQEIRTFQATITAGTAIATPATVDLSFPDRVVRSIRWKVPPGPRGNLGWRLTSGGVQVQPVTPGTWVITDDDTDEWVLSRLLTTGAWQLQGYNTDIYDHTVLLWFACDPVDFQPPAVGGFTLPIANGEVT